MTKPEEPALPDFDLQAFMPYRLAAAAQRTSEELGRIYRDKYGITVAQWRVLTHLAHSGHVSMREIEQRVNMEKSRVSRSAAKLEGAGLIEKQVDAVDRRVVRLSLTAQGRALMADLLPMALRFQAELEARMGEAYAALEEGLDRLMAEVEQS